jgi:opacity protein-like surface antigen
MGDFMRHAIAAVASVIILSSVTAASALPVPFLATTLSLDYDHFSSSGSSLDGFGGGLGWRFGRFIGVQFGGQYAPVKGGGNFGNGYGEVQGFIPLPLTSLRLFGSIGGAYAGTWSGGHGTSGSGYRIGGGLEYDLAGPLGIRAAYHYQNAVAKLSDYSVGLVFRF